MQKSNSLESATTPKGFKNSNALSANSKKIMSKKKMSSAMVAKRKQTMVSNAAGKVMGGLYSK